MEVVVEFGVPLRDLPSQYHSRKRGERMSLRNIRGRDWVGGRRRKVDQSRLLRHGDLERLTRELEYSRVQV